MKIALFGATGHLGGSFLQQALEQGHHISALVRHPEKLTLNHPNLRVHLGDALELEDVRSVVQRQEVVVSALGGGIQGPFEVLTQGLANILSAMEEHNVQRVIATAAAGVLQHDATSLRRDQPGFPLMFRIVSQAHLDAFHILQQSTSRWTLVCPPNMPEGAATGQYRVLADYAPEAGTQISTGDLAHFISRELERPQFIQKRVGIAY
jgi:uncharacterized protein